MQHLSTRVHIASHRLLGYFKVSKDENHVNDESRHGIRGQPVKQGTTVIIQGWKRETVEKLAEKHDCSAFFSSLKSNLNLALGHL